MIRILVSILLFTLSSLSQATKPCALQSKAWFLENVVAPSDLVAIVSILEDSKDQGPRWTKVKIIEKLFDKTDYKDKELTILNWQADQPPLFEYHQGEKLLVWLRKDLRGFSLTNDNWGFCVPAIWTVEGSNTAIPGFLDNNQAKSLSFEEIKQLKAN